MPNIKTYENTSAIANILGWIWEPDKWVGDPESRYITHDTINDKFIFHNKPGDILPTVQIKD